MSKIHYFQRYSSLENTVTNNTLQLIARVYDYSPTRASKLLSDIVGESIEIGLEISQQKPGARSVPDGTILQRSFKILIESKVNSEVDEDQLRRHAGSFADESQKILLLLTLQPVGETEEVRIAAALARQHSGLLFKNVTYQGICSALQGFFEPYESEMQALADDYREYCNDAGLFDQSKDLMRIVPCGQSIELNRKYAIYFQPSDRPYTQHRYVGIYAQKEVQVLWEIDAVFDVSFDGARLVERRRVQGRDTDEYDAKIVSMIHEARRVCGYDIANGTRFFCGRTPRETHYRKASRGGIQGARFLNVREIVGEFANGQELAAGLAARTWV